MEWKLSHNALLYCPVEAPTSRSVKRHAPFVHGRETLLVAGGLDIYFITAVKKLGSLGSSKDF